MAGTLPFEFRIVTQFALAANAYVDWERGMSRGRQPAAGDRRDTRG